MLLKSTSNFKSVQIFAKNMHTTLMVRGSLKVYMERRGESGGLFKAKLYERINWKRMKIIQTPGGNKTDTNLCRRCMAILLKHKFKTRLAIIIYTHILIFKIININWGLIPIIYIIIHYLYLKILSKKMIN